MGYVGGYTLDLYCDHPEHRKYTPAAETYGYPGEFTGETRTECERAAKKLGWSIRRTGSANNGTGTCFCPVHNRLLKTK